jgi:hypothetical protein
MPHVRQRATGQLATDLIEILNTVDDLPSLGNASPQQLEAMATLSRKRFCLLYFKSVCSFITVIGIGLLTWNSGTSINTLLQIFKNITSIDD